MQQTPDVAGKVIQSWIVQGKVLVDGKVINKPGSPVSAQAAICINAAVDKYVCRYVTDMHMSPCHKHDERGASLRG